MVALLKTILPTGSLEPTQTRVGKAGCAGHRTPPEASAARNTAPSASATIPFPHENRSLQRTYHDLLRLRR